MKRRFRRAALLLFVVGLLVVAVVASSASPALGYGKANWQVAINGTATFAGTGCLRILGLVRVRRWCHVR